MANDLIPVSETLPAAAKRDQCRERVLRHRRRRNAGEICVLLELPEAETEDLLVARGYLAAELADDKDARHVAIQRFVRDAILESGSDDSV